MVSQLWHIRYSQLNRQFLALCSSCTTSHYRSFLHGRRKYDIMRLLSVHLFCQVKLLFIFSPIDHDLSSLISHRNSAPSRWLISCRLSNRHSSWSVCSPSLYFWCTGELCIWRSIHVFRLTIGDIQQHAYCAPQETKHIRLRVRNLQEMSEWQGWKCLL